MNDIKKNELNSMNTTKEYKAKTITKKITTNDAGKKKRNTAENSAKKKYNED